MQPLNPDPSNLDPVSDQSPIPEVQRSFRLERTTRRRVWRWLNLTIAGYILMGLWAGIGATATAGIPFWSQKLERQIQRWFYQVRGPVTAPSDVIILEMDQDSLQQEGFYWSDPEKYADLEPLQAWPWQRTAYAIAIERLLEAGARSVSVDVIFSTPSLYGSADDQRLAEVMARYGDRVVIAGVYEAAITNSGQTTQTQLVQPYVDLQIGLDRLGSINFMPDPDGRIYQFGSTYYDVAIRSLNLPELPSFAEATLAAAGEVRTESHGEDIFYYGPPHTFQRVSFWHVLDATNWAVHVRDRTFENKIVLIGATATSLQDFASTPFANGETMPGIEVHANAIASLLENRSLRPLLPHPLAQGFLVLMGVAGLSVLVVLTSHGLKRPAVQFLMFLIGATVWLGVSYGLFVQGGWIIPTAMPVMAIVLSGTSTLTTGVIKIQLEKRQLRQTLERYVAAPIVQEILTRRADDYQQLLKGRRVQAAILFSDIRGFTTLSLNLEPEVLVEQLNAYLNAMVEAILEVGGTVDKFIGDAIMAEFGSPISHGEHQDAMNAILAALGMRKALAKLQEEWEQQGKVVFFNGVGINFGEAIAGDIGSLRRREYAVIGDAVNVASRIEGLTRKFWADILITESVYQRVSDWVDAEDVGEHELKGRGDRKVRVYSVIGLKGEDHSLYQAMMQRLRAHETAAPQHEHLPAPNTPENPLR